MKKLLTLMVIVIFFMATSIAVAVDKPVEIQWEQSCVNGCPDQNVGPVEAWHIYMSDASGVYGSTPIITMPYDGTSEPSYSSPYILSLTGAGVKYFIIRSWNQYAGESGDSNEANYPYNFAGSAIPVNVIFKLSTP